MEQSCSTEEFDKANHETKTNGKTSGEMRTNCKTKTSDETKTNDETLGKQHLLRSFWVWQWCTWGALRLACA